MSDRRGRHVPLAVARPGQPAGRRRPRHAPPLGRRGPGRGLRHARRPPPLRPARDRAAGRQPPARQPAARQPRRQPGAAGAGLPARATPSMAPARQRHPTTPATLDRERYRQRRPPARRGARRPPRRRPRRRGRASRSEAEATALVDDLARRLAASGTSLTEAVGLFVAARRPFLAELPGSAGGGRSTPPASRRSTRSASGLLDRLLLRLDRDLPGGEALT